ncbi:MAG: alpha/beta fold hydrolase [Burkholderiales bacterium]|nr:alpha/beta fold hydrolase [Burkholderiales bacterium]
MTERLVWERDGLDWPHRDTSRFVLAGGLRWHVQQMGQGPVLLLIHGTGASTHSWRDFAPLMARHYTVVAADLPGHAFTDTPSAAQMSLPGMSNALAGLVDVLGLDVALCIGHSAGAAIAARMVLDRRIAPRALVGINGAFLPLDGLPGLLFPPVARLMAATPLASKLFAWRASDRSAVERLIGGTGSALDATGIELYARLVRDQRHAAGALAMMAQWDLRPLLCDLPALTAPVVLLVGANDRAVPPEQARRVAALLPRAPEPVVLKHMGHLAHEERPAEVARAVLHAVAQLSRLPG